MPIDLTDEKAYRAYPAINYSTLKYMAQSPKHYLHALNAPSTKPTASQAFGTAVHCRVLEPFDFPSRYVVWEGEGSKRTKAYKEWAAQQEGRIVLEPEELERVEACAAAVLAHPWVADLLAQPKVVTEQPHVWRDAWAGECKARFDVAGFVNGELISADLKTYASFDVDMLAKQGAKYGWPLQHAHYLTGAARFFDVDMSEVGLRAVNIVVEANAPHDVTVIEWSEHTMDAAFAKHRGLLDRVAECKRRDSWPGRTSSYADPIVVDAPEWAL